jgi:hypothetical protein
MKHQSTGTIYNTQPKSQQNSTITAHRLFLGTQSGTIRLGSWKIVGDALRYVFKHSHDKLDLH